MKISDYISLTIDRLPKGYVFTYVDFPAEVNQKEAVIKALNRMVATGKIAKLSKANITSLKPHLILKNLFDGEKSTLVRLAMKYPPAARKLLGTLLDSILADAVTLSLYNSLNPITKYRLPGLKKVFPEAIKWNFS